MPILNNSDYRPIWPLRNGHLNTMFPPLFRQSQQPGFVRERISTPDDDFLDIDWLKKENKKLAVLCHGLEGSSGSQYILGTAGLLHENGWDIVAMNYRSCSGELNRQLRMYHSGATIDLHTVLAHVNSGYNSIVLVGFSLGGNLVLKYANDGIYTLNPKIEKVVAVSVPIDLAGGAVELLKKQNLIYQRRFLKSLLPKVKAKYKQYPDQIPIEHLSKVKHLTHFDDYYTGPLHGFKDAADYYAQCNSLQFLPNVSLPTLLINAQDDPFLSKTCFPIELAKESDLLHLLMPKYGGHVGFSIPGATYYWEEQQILEFVNEM